MAIVIIGDSRSPHLQKWVDAFNESGVEVKLISDFASSSPIIKSIRVFPLAAILSYLRICFGTLYWRFSSKRSFHIHYVSRYSLVSLLVPSKRLVSFPYGSDVLIAPEYSKLLRFLIRTNLRRSSNIVVSSPYLKTTILELESELNIDVVPFGVERKHLSDLSIVQRDNRILRLGCFKFSRIHMYGFDRIIEIFSIVLSIRNGDARLYLIDHGPDLDELKLELKAKGLFDKVEFLPKAESSDEMFSYLDTVDFTLYPSRSESFGVSLIESMAAGKPSFVSEVGGMVDIVTDGENSFFCDSSAIKTAEKICSLYEDVEKYITVAKEAIVTVKHNYVWEQAFERFRLSSLGSQDFH